MNRGRLVSHVLWQKLVPGLISGLWLVTPATASNVSLTIASETPLRTAQTPLTESAFPTIITGRLDANSPTLPDGSHYQEHTFEGKAGDQIVIELSSEEFDTYLILKKPDGEVIAENDDGISGTDSVVIITLPTTGTYTILANTYTAGATGSYQLERRAATEADRQLVEAAHLSQRVIEIYQAGRYQEAIPLAERSLSILEQALGANHPFVAESLNNLAVLYRAQGNYAQSEPLYQRSLSIYEQALGANHPAVATSLNNLAELYREQGNYTQAEPLYQRSLSIREQALGANHPDVAQSLNNLAALYQVQDNYAQAETLYRRSLAIFEQALGVNHPNVATPLNNLAGLYQEQGNHAQSELLLQRSLAIFEQALGENHPLVATSLNDLANLYRAQGNYAQSEPLYERSLAILEQALGANHPDVATTLNNLAELYRTQSNYAQAEPLYRRALSIREQALGANHPYVAISLNNLAELYQDQGNYAQAEPLHRRALSIREQALGANHSLVAQSLNDLANLYQDQGNYAQSEPLHQRALSILEQALGENHPDVAQSLNGLANLYRAQGNYAQVEPLYQRVRSIYEQALETNHPNVAASLNNLANLYQDQGNYAQAEPLYQRALSILEQALGENHPFVAQSLNNLAELYQAQGNYAQAELLYRRSLAILEQALGANHPDVATSLNNLAAFSWAQNDLTSALDFFEQSLPVEELSLNLNLIVGSEAYKQNFLFTFTGTTNNIISLHLQAMIDSPVAAQLALLTVLQRKGRLLDLFTNSQQILREQLDPDSQALLTTLTAKRTQLSNLYFSRSESLPLEQYRTQVDALQLEIQQLEANLSRRSSQFRALNQSIDIPTIQSLLPEQTTLVELVRYQVFNPQAERNERFGEARYAAYLLQANGSINGIDLGSAAEIEPLIETLQRALRNPGYTVEEVKEAARALDARVMAPIRARLGDTNHLLISPDGAFNLIPFEALVDETGHYLVENYTLTYLTSGRDLLRLQAQATAIPQTNPVLLANPIFERPGNTVIAQTPTRFIDLREETWTALLATADEADAIATQLPQALNLQGLDATEAALKQVNRPRFLHIATHGFFESRNSSGNLQEVVLTDNPLLRSGLVLSGVNVGQSGTDEDGIVSALEVSNLNLLGTQLVVLSACETASGDLSLGEGVYGLRRALVLAGSQSQLISLWQVQDDTTRDLMVEYYQHLLSGMGRSEALRRTQLAMLNNEATAHPYYWAPFINSGDWHPIDRFSGQ
jgi:CHAT domain-containing protein/tetratricopeptide (TPR) repeat protein